MDAVTTQTDYQYFNGLSKSENGTETLYHIRVYHYLLILSNPEDSHILTMCAYVEYFSFPRKGGHREVPWCIKKWKQERWQNG